MNITLDVPSFNSDFGSNFPKLLMIPKNNFSIDTRNISLNSAMPKSIIQSNPNSNLDYPGRYQSAKGNCSSIFSDINYIINELNTSQLNKISKIERIGRQLHIWISCKLSLRIRIH